MPQQNPVIVIPGITATTLVDQYPRINLVQRLVTRHLLPGYRGEVWGRRVPGSGSWNPPIDDLPEKQY